MPTNPEFVDSQGQVLDLFEQFVGNRQLKVFILTGQAGTGKTEVIAEMVRRITIHGRNVVLMAPTGQAASRLFQRTGREAYTVHSTIYEPSGGQVGDDDEAPQLYFGLRRDDFHSHDTLFIVDEASLISNEPLTEEARKSSELIFGSTNLLADIVGYTTESDRQIVFVGDTNQLPPIGQDRSPALDASTFRDLNLSVMTGHLRELHRRSETSVISQLSAALASALSDGNLPETVHLHEDPAGGLQLMRKHDFGADELEQFRQGTATLVAWRHSTIRYWNRHIRSLLGHSSPYPNVRESLILQTPYVGQGCLLHNGDEVTLVEIAGEPSTVTERLKRGDESVEVSVNLLPAIVQETVSDGTTRNHSVMLVLECLESMDQDLRHDIRRVLWIDFVKRASQNGLSRKDSLFLDLYREDARVNALRCSFPYARTIHKSQGGEWRDVIVDLSGLKGVTSNNLRLVYTAVTRAKVHLAIRNWPFHTTSVDITDVGRRIVERLSRHGINDLHFQNVNNGVSIRNADGTTSTVINAYLKKGQLSSIHVQKAPPNLQHTLEADMKILRCELLEELSPPLDVELEMKLLPALQSLQDRGCDTYAWTHSMYRVSLAVSSDSNYCELNYVHKADGTRSATSAATDSSSLFELQVREIVERLWQ